MGANQFMVTSKGKTITEAFTAAVEDAKFEYGHRGYTGSIAEKDTFVEIKVPKGKKPYEYAKELLYKDDPRIEDKWGPAGAILLRQTDRKTEVPNGAKEENRNVQKGRREWVTEYDVVEVDIWNRSERLIQSYRTQTEAEKSAKRLAKERNKRMQVRITKRLKNGSTHIVDFVPTTKTKVIKNGWKEYLFFGKASC